MANWITLRQAAEKYETTVKDVLSWSELPEITFTYVNYTLLLNDDSVCDLLNCIVFRLKQEKTTVVPSPLKMSR